MPILLDAGPSERGWHRLETARRCMQLYAYKYLLKVELEAGDALIRGSLVHIALAHHYARMREMQRGRDPGLYYAPDVAVHMLAEKLAKEFKSDVPLAKAPGLAKVAAAYEAHWLNEGFRILHVEEPVEAQVGPNKRRFTMRIDLIVEDRTGAVYVIDHKTAAKPDTRTVDRYSMSGQFSGLALFGKALFGERFGGTRINFITGEEPPFKFSRTPPHPAPHLQSAFRQIVEDTEADIERLAASGRDPWDYPKTASDLVCVHSYGRCDAYGLCQWGPSQLALLKPVQAGTITVNFGTDAAAVKPHTPET